MCYRQVPRNLSVSVKSTDGQCLIWFGTMVHYSNFIYAFIVFAMIIAVTYKYRNTFRVVIKPV